MAYQRLCVNYTGMEKYYGAEQSVKTRRREQTPGRHFSFLDIRQRFLPTTSVKKPLKARAV